MGLVGDSPELLEKMHLSFVSNCILTLAGQMHEFPLLTRCIDVSRLDILFTTPQKEQSQAV